MTMNWRACLTRRAADARGRLQVKSTGGHSQPEAARAGLASATQVRRHSQLLMLAP